MTSNSTLGREPITIVELEQPRCALRFGAGLCTATGVKCYNTQSTCGDLDNYDGTGSIKWRFVDDRPTLIDVADYSDADNPETAAFPCLSKASTTSSQINAAANLTGVSPLGVTGTASVSLKDFPWNDAIGDFYIADRSWYSAGKPLEYRGGFWALWTARNKLFNNMLLRVFDGYVGQDLVDMRERLYVLDSVDGPNESGAVTLSGVDPLRLAGDKKALFPPTSDLDAYGDFGSSATDVTLFGLGSDLTSDLGNTGSTRYVVIGKEIISYTGNTDLGDGVYQLTGVTRGALGTEAASISDRDKAQRAGRYEDLPLWTILHDMLTNHSEMPPAFIDSAAWDDEGFKYMPTYKSTRTVIAPTEIKTLAGQITQQGLFYIWWAEESQKLKLLAVRPPSETPQTITEDANIMAGASLTRDPSARLSTCLSILWLGKRV